MSKRQAILSLIILALLIIALLSVGAYMVQKQNDDNTTDALTTAIHTAMPTVAMPVAKSTASNDATQSALPNDAVDTDTAAIQYKTVVGQGYTFDAPIDWNSLQKTVNDCTTETIVSPQNTTIDITPNNCATSSATYAHSVQKEGYTISTATADAATYNYVIQTFQLIS